MGLCYRQLTELDVSQEVLNSFDCGHPDFNDFIREDAIDMASNGEGVTYLLVDEAEAEQKNVTSFFAFATIKTTALYYENDSKLLSESCIEIKYFAIAKSFQRVRTGPRGIEKYYSTVFFENLLMDLYEMSTKVVGFTGIFLRANENGLKLYKRKNFVDATEYMIPFEKDDEFGKCLAMYLPISENIYSIFGME